MANTNEQTQKASTPLLAPNLGDVKQTLDRILFESDEPIVVSIRGGWGEGKTYFWKNTIAPLQSEPRPGYVSVFGAESLAAIRSQVVVEATASHKLVTETLDEAISKRFPLLGKTGPIAQFIAKRLGGSTVPAKLISEVLEHVVFTPGWVLCIDDIERLPSSSVDFDALLGYVNSLRDDRQVKVVLIYNRDKVIGEKQASLDRYLEKVVDRELSFAPNISEILRVVFKNDIPNEELLSELERRCSVLGLRNIRILKRARLFYEELLSALPEQPDDDFIQTGIFSLLLYCWVQFASEDAADQGVTFQFLDDYNELSISMMRHAREQSHSSEEQSIDEGNEERAEVLLHEFGYLMTDEFDKILIEFVQSSVLRRDRLLTEHEKFTNNISQGKLEEKYRDIWHRYYHGTLRDTEKEFGAALVSATRDYFDFIPLNQLDQTLVMLEKLGRDTDSIELLDEFRVRRADVFDKYASDSTIEPIKYARLRVDLEEASKLASIDDRPLADVIRSAAKDQFLNLDDRKRLADFSAQELADYFLSNEMDRLTSTMRHLEKISRQPDEDDKVVNGAILEAARIIADTSRINRFRMESMGLVDRENRSIEPRS